MNVGQDHTLDKTPYTEEEVQREPFYVTIVDEVGPVAFQNNRMDG